MRKALTHYCRQLSPANYCFGRTHSPSRRFLSISRLSSSFPPNKLVPYPSSRGIHFKMSPILNGELEPLALAGGSPLKVKNSLSKEKEIFKPAHDNKVTWYSCGPTVYDSSHLGHARNYVSMDIIRRVLQGYFGYNVNFVQNVTDIDDKIIIRARQNFIWNQYLKTNPQIEDVDQKVRNAWKIYASKIFPPEAIERYNVDNDFTAFVNENATADAKTDEKFSMHVNALKLALSAIIERNPETYFTKVKDVYLPILDKEQGANFTELSIFKQFTSFWEDDYNNDMLQLNVLKPTQVIRVSDVVPEIVTFVEKIIESGSAYSTSDGDVYFDVRNFQASGHQYAKLKPSNAGDTEKLLAEGEGSLSIGAGKKTNVDFALWKSSKPGEPHWSSPWGEGRPGWHIECSVMASMAFGSNMDIHSGGIDLAFPHHDNELAQSEAYHGCQQWVNYFLHTGHLSIEGQKMSKSLKNFITIREALDKYSARQLRLAFLTTAWDGPMDFKDDVMDEMKSLEEKFCVWFSKAELIQEQVENGRIQIQHKSDAIEVKRLEERFRATKEAVHTALSDNFNTRAAITSTSELINDLNKEFKATNISSTAPTLLDITKWITRVLATFGFDPSTTKGRLGWAETRDSLLPEIKRAVRYRDTVRAKAISKSSFDDIDTLSQQLDSLLHSRDPGLAPYLDGLNNFVTTVANLTKTKASFAEYLGECDRFRDETMLEFGVSIDDTDFGIATIRFADASRLIAERDRKRAAESAMAQQKAIEKQKRKEEEERKALEKLEKGKLSPAEMFRTKEYSQWDEEGVPTHDAEGVELTKAKRKKLLKDRDAQKKLHDAYLKWAATQQS